MCSGQKVIFLFFAYFVHAADTLYDDGRKTENSSLICRTFLVDFRMVGGGDGVDDFSSVSYTYTHKSDESIENFRI